MALLQTSGDPIDAIALRLRALTPTALQRATVILPAERHAHALRRHVCAVLHEPQLLAGVRIFRPVDFARELIVRSGHPCRVGWEAIRRLRIAQCFESSATLAAELHYFRLEQLRGGRGYAEAFARTIGDLENSGMDRQWALVLALQLASRDPGAAKRLHDVAVVWDVVDSDQRQILSNAELLCRAASIVRDNPAAAAPFATCITLLASSPSIPLLRLLAALPEVLVVLPNARPLRTGTQRWRKHLPIEARSDAANLESTTAPTELAIVRRYLLEVPEVLTDPSRTRSTRIDGSISIEEHASVEEEIEAVLAWVADQIHRGVPLEQIALLVPDIDPYAGLLLDRIARLAQRLGRSLPVHVAGGLSLATSAAGLRVLAVLRALQRGLDAESTIRILPWLRDPNEGEAEPPPRLSPTKAARLVYESGIVGGAAAGGTREWVERFTRRRDLLLSVIAEPEEATTVEHKRSIDRQQAQRILKDIDHVLPAVTALQDLAVAVLEEGPLSQLWPSLHEFCKRWLRLPPDPPNLPAILAESLAPILDDSVAASMRGTAALSMLRDSLHSLRRSTTRFGEPCLFVGTPAQAVGLSFRAVRMLGLAEGLVPHTAHDDPILPDVARITIEEAAVEQVSDVVLPRLADKVLDEIHDVFRVIATTTEQLSLSVPRQSLDRSEREVSGVLLEIATALGRAGSLGQAEGDVPSAARLRSAYFQPGLLLRQESMGARPVSPRSELLCLPRQDAQTGEIAQPVAVPADWTLPGARSLSRLGELQRLQASLEGLDGSVVPAWDRLSPPGLSPERPLSATAVRMLLECPHRFLFERILFLKEPARRPPTDTVDAITYGNLFHLVAERFLRAHGAAICKHDDDEAHWIDAARQLAASCFDERVGDLLVRGADTIARERSRLMNQMEYLVRYEWRAGSRNYYASELGFGDPTPVALSVESGSVFLRGAIDRVDQVGPRAFQVRDLKTGRVHDFAEDPVNPSRDVQIGVYALIIEALQLVEDAEVSLAAYVHPSATQEADRAFTGIELDALRRATRYWLDVAASLLRSGIFPRTTDARDCTYCPFVPVCADGAQLQSQQKLLQTSEGSAPHRFLRLKQQRAQDT